jgi:hypothetical protein
MRSWLRYCNLFKLLCMKYMQNNISTVSKLHSITMWQLQVLGSSRLIYMN